MPCQSAPPTFLPLIPVPLSQPTHPPRAAPLTRRAAVVPRRRTCLSVAPKVPEEPTARRENPRSSPLQPARANAQGRDGGRRPTALDNFLRAVRDWQQQTLPREAVEEGGPARAREELGGGRARTVAAVLAALRELRAGEEEAVKIQEDEEDGGIHWKGDEEEEELNVMAAGFGVSTEEKVTEEEDTEQGGMKEEKEDAEAENPMLASFLESLSSFRQSDEAGASVEGDPNSENLSEAEEEVNAENERENDVETRGAKVSPESTAGEGEGKNLDEETEERSLSSLLSDLRAELEAVQPLLSRNEGEDQDMSRLLALIDTVVARLVKKPAEDSNLASASKEQNPTRLSGRQNGVASSEVSSGPETAESVEANNEIQGLETASSGESEEDRTSLLAGVTGAVAGAAGSTFDSVRRLASEGTNNISQAATMAVLRALGVEPLDSAEEAEMRERLPQHPFDPLLALVLANYSFRAYYDPPRSSYREMYASWIAGSSKSGMDSQVIYTEFMYPDAMLIARRADGLFMLSVQDVDGLDGSFVTAEINGAVITDLVKKRNCTMLRQLDPQTRKMRRMLRREEDTLHINVYTSQKAHDGGKQPTYLSSVALAGIVTEGLDKGEIADGGVHYLDFSEVAKGEKDKDFFRFSLLPSELKLPFQEQMNSCDDDQDDEKVQSATLSVRASFVPFPKDAREVDREDIPMELLSTDGSEEAISIDEDVFYTPDPPEAINSILEKEMEPGALPAPTDWMKLAGLGREVAEQVTKADQSGYAANVREDVDGSLFIISAPTDTKVWLFHDEARRDVIISFRGTEQVSWRDFFTDAQLFLQRWAPGENIDLNVNTSNTVGLPDLISSTESNPDSTVPEDASAVHYGFLRAYLSVRDALFRAINMICQDDLDEYSLHFAGHSLGGALAILAASDFRAKHEHSSFNVSCMSYGAPKVGNIRFATLFNDLVPNAFRVVNDLDLVSRMPRSMAGSGALGRYKHAGRTVLVNEQGEYWIEGRSGANFSVPMSSLSDPFRERYGNLQDLVAFEQNLWTGLLSGRSVQQHMETSYFTTMRLVLKKFTADQVA